MAALPDRASSKEGRHSLFLSTRWTLIRAAGDSHAEESSAALEQLCRTYWHPVYVHIRRKGHGADESSDLVQAFFAYLLEKKVVARADQNRGRFRSFLLGTLRNFLQKRREHDFARKRGGDCQLVSLDFELAENRLRNVPLDEASPDRLFDYHWALTAMEQAFNDVRDEYQASDRGPLFEAIRPYVTANGSDESYAETAAKLRTSVGAVKSAVFRLRRRFQTETNA